MRPTLQLNFAATKRLDPRITFSRASSGTYFDAFGVLKSAPANTARFDHDPVTGVCKGLLIEEARTNLLTYSEQFDSDVWGKLNDVSITPNACVAPDGTMTADKITAQTDSSYFFQSVAYGGAGARTFSVYLRSDTPTIMVIAMQAIPSWQAIPVTCNVTTEWQRFSATYTAEEGTTHCSAVCGAWGGFSAGKSIYFWGAQLEAGAFPTSYIPTTSAQVTRAADVATMTGENFSSWYRQDEGTFVACMDTNNTAPADKRAVFASDGTTSNFFSLHYSSVGAHSSVVKLSGTATYASGEGAYTTNTLYRRALAYKDGDTRSATGGVVSGVTEPNGAIPTVNQLAIGSMNGGSAYLNGHLARIAYYPKRISNAELQGLTA